MTSAQRPAGGVRARHEIGRSLTVTCGPVDLLTYVYAADDPQVESPRPYFHPVSTLAGDVVTAYRPWDHMWHKGIAWSLPCVGGHNFWGGATYVHGQGYVPLGNDGSMDHERITQLAVADDGVDFAHELTWRAEPAADAAVGPEVIRERRCWRAGLVPDERRAGSGDPAEADSAPAWVLTFATTMTNVSGATLALGSPTTKGRENAGYGGLFWRGPRAFTDGTVLAPDRAGGDEIRGSRGAWAGFSARHDEVDRSSSLVIVDDATNPQHPPRWFLRSAQFPAVNPAPFFSEEVDLTPGASLTFRYAVLIADGPADPARGERLAELGRQALAVWQPDGDES